jgi:uncharacterized protein YijF (DUF1287 family)
MIRALRREGVDLQRLVREDMRASAQLEGVLFAWEIVGHYRWR